MAFPNVPDLSDRLTKTVKEIMRGADASIVLETITILREIAEGAEDEEEAERFVREVCKSISVAMKAKGVKIKPEECVEKLMDVVEEVMAKNAYRRILYKLRRKRAP